ncbi:MAG TPA: hypothetical protein DCL48_15725, partial [Alphaproteobacteria bacterium]|nr:hypothetical protein [Alphaproteobacteria bacterium]
MSQVSGGGIMGQVERASAQAVAMPVSDQDWSHGADLGHDSESAFWVRTGWHVYTVALYWPLAYAALAFVNNGVFGSYSLSGAAFSSLAAAAILMAITFLWLAPWAYNLYQWIFVQPLARSMANDVTKFGFRAGALHAWGEGIPGAIAFDPASQLFYACNGQTRFMRYVYPAAQFVSAYTREETSSQTTVRHSGRFAFGGEGFAYLMGGRSHATTTHACSVTLHVQLRVHPNAPVVTVSAL